MDNESRTVLVEPKIVYGRERIYPANQTADKFAALIKRKVFSIEDINIIESLGFKVEVKAPELKR